MLEKLNRINYLYDIYGELLSDKQRLALQLYYLEGLSLGEIAVYYKISRQAVHDLLGRAVRFLESAEDKMGLHNRYFYRRERLLEAREIAGGPVVEGENLSRLKVILDDLFAENEQA